MITSIALAVAVLHLFGRAWRSRD